MKNLPEIDFWKQITSRLKNYEEDPEDDWDKIAAAIPKASGAVVGFNRMSDTVVLILLAFLLGFHSGQTTDHQSDLSSITSITDKHKSSNAIGKVRPTDSTSKPQLLSPTTSGKGAIQAMTRSNLASSDALESLNRGKDENQLSKAPSSTSRVNNLAVKAGIISDEKLDRDNIISSPYKATSGSDQGNYEVEQTEVSDNPHDDQKSSVNENPMQRIDETSKQALAINPNPSEENRTVPSVDTSAIMPVVQKKEINIKPAETKVIRPQKNHKKFLPSVFLSVSPSLAYQKITPSTDDDINITRLNSSGILSPNRFGINIAGGFQMQVASKVEVFVSGSYYSQQPSVSYSYTGSGDLSLTEGDEWSFILTPEVNTKRFTYRMRNAGVSAGVLYHIRGVELMHKLGGAIYYERGMLKHLGEETYNNSASSYFGYQLLYRMELALNSRTSIFAQPTFSRSVFAKEELDEPFKMKPYRAGIGFGIVYHF